MWVKSRIPEQAFKSFSSILLYTLKFTHSAFPSILSMTTYVLLQQSHARKWEVIHNRKIPVM